MNEIGTYLIAIGAGVLICILGAYIGISRKRRKEKMEIHITRVKMATEPGYKPPGEDMDMTIRDGVVTYRKRRGRRKERDNR